MARSEKLVIYGEQGIGDELLFASCIPDALAHCDNVIIETLVKSYRQIFTRHTWSMVPNEQGCNELRSPNYM